MFAIRSPEPCFTKSNAPSADRLPLLANVDLFSPEPLKSNTTLPVAFTVGFTFVAASAGTTAAMLSAAAAKKVFGEIRDAVNMTAKISEI